MVPACSYFFIGGDCEWIFGMNQGLYNFGERAWDSPGREDHWLQAKAVEMPHQCGEAFQVLCYMTDSHVILVEGLGSVPQSMEEGGHGWQLCACHLTRLRFLGFDHVPSISPVQCLSGGTVHVTCRNCAALQSRGQGKPSKLLCRSHSPTGHRRLSDILVKLSYLIAVSVWTS